MYYLDALLVPQSQHFMNQIYTNPNKDAIPLLSPVLGKGTKNIEVLQVQNQTNAEDVLHCQLPFVISSHGLAIFCSLLH
jgi:hypothetical protein